MLNRLFWLGCILVSTWAAGCNKQPPDSSLQVSGTVTLDGKPVEGAVVNFIPIDQTPGGGASGTTDAAGRYLLQPRRRGEGVVEGKYRVRIARFVSHEDPSDPSSSTPQKGKAKAEGTFQDFPKFDGMANVLANVSYTNNKFDFDVGADAPKPNNQ